MKANKLENLAKELEVKRRVRFPQTFVFESLFEALREEKERRGITWERFLTEAGIEWLKKKAQ